MKLLVERVQKKKKKTGEKENIFGLPENKNLAPGMFVKCLKGDIPFPGIILEARGSSLEVNFYEQHRDLWTRKEVLHEISTDDATIISALEKIKLSSKREGFYFDL